MAHTMIDDDGIHEICVLAVHQSSVCIAKITITPETVTIYDARGKELTKIKRSDLSEMSISDLASRLRSSQEG